MIQVETKLATSYRHYTRGYDWDVRKLPSPQVKRFCTKVCNHALTLEIGSGNGVDANYMRSRGIRLLATDVRSTVDVLCSAHNLPFADDTFDALFCRGVMHLLDYRTALYEIDRVIKRNGLVFLSYPQDVYDRVEYYQLVPVDDVKTHFQQIHHYTSSVNTHGEHRHHFVEVLGVWRKCLIG
ncbi:MAG: class I SAM-dependent methyltransferase [Dehalococcoidia bacterium]|jgi:2-polyprenyl-3-methyl-5-hydroxy-6-metoxy-1,4-benzoquinol methylase